MKIAHCQFESWCGEFDRNLRRFEEGLQQADAAGAAVVSFPECFLTGYPDVAETARRDAFAADSPAMDRVLDVTSRHEALAIVGFNELRNGDLYNTALVAHRGHLLGVYSKCAAYQSFHRQGRDFPVWEHQGVCFGVLICADGGYIEPARILALKGAQVIFAPHFNCIRDSALLQHFQKVRADHTARAMENGVYFVRGNNVILDPSKSGITRQPGIGYGDSYVMDPAGEILVRSRRHVEDFITAEIDPSAVSAAQGSRNRSAWSWREFSPFLEEAVRQRETRKP
jgi:5-aminopentanamidase